MHFRNLHRISCAERIQQTQFEEVTKGLNWCCIGQEAQSENGKAWRYPGIFAECKHVERCITPDTANYTGWKTEPC